MILIVQSLWNSSITDAIVGGAKQVFDRHNLDSKLIQVPGALEIPLAVQWTFDQSPVDAVVACGCVIRGETYHFEIVANESSRALTDLSLKLKIPVGNAILAVYHLDQALERTGGKHGNKGEEAADSVVKMLALRKTL